MSTQGGEAGAAVPTTDGTAPLAAGPGSAAAAVADGAMPSSSAMLNSPNPNTTALAQQSTHPKNPAGGGGAPPPSWPTGISNAPPNTMPATGTTVKTEPNTPEPQETTPTPHPQPATTTTIATEHPTEPIPPATAAPTAAPPAAASGGAPAPAPAVNGGGAGEAGVTTGKNPEVVYSAENLAKLFNHLPNARTPEQLKAMSLADRGKYATEMVQVQQQQQVINTLRAKATTVESCIKLANQINDNIKKMEVESNDSTTAPTRKIELRKRKTMFQMALKFLLQQHTKLQAAVPGSAAAPITIGEDGGGERAAAPPAAHTLSKVALEGAQAQAMQQEAASQLAHVARKAGTFEGFDSGPGERTSAIVQSMDMSQKPLKAASKRTHDEMCRWLEKRKRTKVLKSRDHALASATVTAETPGPVEKDALLEQLLSYHVHAAEEVGTQNEEEHERACTLLVQNSVKLMHRYHKVLERQPELENAAELIVLGRDWNTREQMTQHKHRQSMTQHLLREEEMLRNPPEQVSMANFDFGLMPM